jgi:hypothetical protein
MRNTTIEEKTKLKKKKKKPKKEERRQLCMYRTALRITQTLCYSKHPTTDCMRLMNITNEREGKLGGYLSSFSLN